MFGFDQTDRRERVIVVKGEVFNLPAQEAHAKRLESAQSAHFGLWMLKPVSGKRWDVADFRRIRRDEGGKAHECDDPTQGKGPRLILADLDTPQVSGMELISLVRSRYLSISIVAMSGAYQGKAVPASVIADTLYPKRQHPHHLLTTIAILIATSPDSRNAQEDRARPTLDS